MATLSWLEHVLTECYKEEGQHQTYGEPFISITKTYDLTKPEYIRSTLNQNCLPASLEQDVLNEYGPARIIFLILARTGKLNILDRLLQNGFSDRDLPLRVYNDNGANIIQTTRGKNPFGSTALDYINAEAFRNQQWPFLSPILGVKFAIEIEKNVPLPLIEKKIHSSSGFSTVFRVKVHPDHIRTMRTEYLAMKMLRSGTEDQIKNFNKELNNLERFQGMDHFHLVKAVCACIRRIDIHSQENEAFFFFPWADGGDLHSLWTGGSISGMGVVSWMLREMAGLCSALAYLSGNGWRHSDLKPANILHFSNNSRTGVLKITDLGISKFHILSTSRRLNGTTAKYTTKRYCPPEFDKLFNQSGGSGDFSNPDSLSRNFDIWSLGCVFIEFLLWVIRGHHEYREFDQTLEKTDGRFWSSSRPGLDKRVQKQIKTLKLSIKKWEGRRKPDRDAFTQVLKLVEDHMLLDKSKDRYDAGKVELEMNGIRHRYGKSCSRLDESDISLDLTGAFQKNTDETADLGDPSHSLSPGELNTMAIPPSNTAAQNQSAKLQDHWIVSTDNEFARKVLSRSAIAPLKESSQLCYKCSILRIWETDAKISGIVRDFGNRSSSCGLCNLLYAVSKSLGLGEDQELNCVRSGPTFKTIAPPNQPVLSLFSDPGYDFDDLGFAQVGYPTLPFPNSPERYRLFQQWLRVCDYEHGHTSEVFGDSDTVQMPTRLIYVGESTERLEEIKDTCFRRYLALSHCWGGGPSLCTLTSNIKTFRERIPHERLSLNFQEAIRVTRALGISYLWIDSLCIIQDDLQDWKREAARMGQVFSNAYCTIAATSAAASNEGFIAPNISSPLSVAIRSPGNGLLHVSEFMENFHQDVELVTLNTRGWVMQERALSRRTLHFASRQVYWECGNGVHCERLFKLSNPQSALFADSDFPTSILKYYKGGRITLFQDLYEKYSRLNFSRISDRPVAILGLEKRLSTVLQTRGEFGIFEQYLARSLLWSRPEHVFLSRIPFAPSTYVPSWSWMAYEGPITYANLPFNKVEWSSECVLSSGGKDDLDRKRPCLKAFARYLTLQELDILQRVKLDEESGVKASDLRGVVLGKDKDKGLRDQLHYVLLITLSKKQPEGNKAYFRAGVAWLFHHNIASVGEYIDIY